MRRIDYDADAAQYLLDVLTRCEELRDPHSAIGMGMIACLPLHELTEDRQIAVRLLVHRNRWSEAAAHVSGDQRYDDFLQWWLVARVGHPPAIVEISDSIEFTRRDRGELIRELSTDEAATMRPHLHRWIPLQG